MECLPSDSGVGAGHLEVRRAVMETATGSVPGSSRARHPRGSSCAELCNTHSSKHLRLSILLQPERKISASPNRQFQGGNLL